MTRRPRALTPHRLFGVLGVTLLVLVASLSTAPPSDADVCKNFGLSARCRIVFGGDKSDGGGGGGGGKPRPPCHKGAPEYEGVPCESVSGLWENARKCYVQLADPQPDASDEDRPNARAKLYTCAGFDDEGEIVLRDSFWSDDTPDTDEPGDLQEDLERGFEVKFRAMNPGLAPTPIPLGAGFHEGWRMAPVGLWVWMWPRIPNDSAWGPISAQDPGGTGYSINAGVQKVVWEMGDGSKPITCGESPAFQPYMRDRTPQCGHKYTKPGNYLVRVTTFWHIDYVDASGPNNVDLEFTQSLIIRIGENQVVSK